MLGCCHDESEHGPQSPQPEQQAQSSEFSALKIYMQGPWIQSPGALERPCEYVVSFNPHEKKNATKQAFFFFCPHL